MMKKTYLGDGVYAAVDGLWNLVLTTEDGIRVTNQIFLEPEVLSALMKFLTKANEAASSHLSASGRKQ